MSYLSKQASAFKGSLSSAASKISNPKAAAAAAAAVNDNLAPPSPSPSATSDPTNTPTAKRKRDEIYSQPQITGYGKEVNSQVVFAVGHLKEKGTRRSAEDLLGYLSLHRQSDEHKKALLMMLRKNPRVTWRPDAIVTEQSWMTGTYEYTPIIPGVKDATSLIAYLQKRKDASGVKVVDLKDGWADCEEVITRLEEAHKILVMRTTKENIARAVWLDDASLHRSVQPEFKATWIRTPLPGLDDMHRKLTTASLKPTSEDPRLAASNAPAVKKQKKRANKSSSKSTNLHMKHLMDFSHMRRG